MKDTLSSDEIEALERQGWEALSSPNAARFYEEVMADDGLMVFPSLVMDKQAALRAIHQAEPWSTFELSDVRVTASQGVRLIIYRAVAQRSGQPQYQAVMSSVYVRRGDDWKLLLHQQTPSRSSSARLLRNEGWRGRRESKRPAPAMTHGATAAIMR